MLLLHESLGSPIVGVVCCKVDPFRESSDEDKNIGQISMLAVRSDRTNKGYGTQLMEEAEHRLLELGCKYASLDLLQPAEWQHDVKTWLAQWYERLGYK